MAPGGCEFIEPERRQCDPAHLLGKKRRRIFKESVMAKYSEVPERPEGELGTVRGHGTSVPLGLRDPALCSGHSLLLTLHQKRESEAHGSPKGGGWISP